MSAAPHLFFSYSAADGFDVHKTLEAAKAAAQNALEAEEEGAADDGWDEDAALSICYGSIAGGAEEAVRMPWADHMRQTGYGEEDCKPPFPFDEFIEFKLEEYAGIPDPARAIEKLREWIEKRIANLKSHRGQKLAIFEQTDDDLQLDKVIVAGGKLRGCGEVLDYINSREHEGRTWLELDGRGGGSVRDSSRFSDADVEGFGQEMLAIAEAIEKRGEVYFKRCAVRVEGNVALFKSPRNSQEWGVCELSEADELAREIRMKLSIEPTK